MKSFLTLLIITLAIWAVPANAQEQEDKRIRLEITVTNVEVPVRVYIRKKNKPVKDLQKKDFKLFIDGEEHSINGFFEVRKKIKTPPSQHKPRLFFLMFNVITYEKDLEQGLDKLFNEVIRTGDRIMVLTNSMYLKDKMVADPKDDLRKIKKVLQMEARKMKQALTTLEYNLRYLASSFKLDAMGGGSSGGRRAPTDTGLPTDTKELIILRFIEEYLGFLTEFKTKFLNPDQAFYLKTADYLKEQKVEKWALNFYQAPEFPLLKNSMIDSGIYDRIAAFAATTGQQNPYVYEVEFGLGKPNASFNNTMGNIFLNTGVTFHTLLMKTRKREFYEDYKYTSVPIDSEHITRKITKLTGGNIVGSNNIGKFIKKISTKEDVYYMLTYAPKQGAKKGKLKISIDNRDYKMVYDNQHRPRYVKQAVLARKKKIPQINIRNVEIKDGLIYVFVSGVQLKQAPEKEKTKKGNILLGIKILNETAQEVSGTKKGFTCRAETIPIRLRLPALTTGDYQVLLEVNDALSGKNDVELKDLKMTADHTLKPGEKAFGFISAPVPKETEYFEEIAANSGLMKQLEDSADTPLTKITDDPDLLPRILAKVADYCDRLQAISLNFFCLEEVNEVFLKTLQWRGKHRKEERRIVYGYQLVKDKGKPREKRAQFEKDGKEEIKANVPLHTRFKYKQVVYGPLIFNRGAQPHYRYEIIGKKNWKQKEVYIVEAVPKAGGKAGVVSGRFWVAGDDFSILRIEIYQTTLTNYGEIQQLAGMHKLAPKITIINEYEVVKRGVRFPSKLYYEEAYKDKRGRMMVQSLGNVTFKDYRFFAVDTKVTDEDPAARGSN